MGPGPLFFLGLLGALQGGTLYTLHFPEPRTTTNYVQITPTFDKTTELSVCTWARVKPDLVAQVFIGYACHNVDNYFLFQVNSKTGDVQITMFGKDPKFVVNPKTNPFEGGEWVHICVTWSNKNGIIGYINGVEESKNAAFHLEAEVQSGGYFTLGQDHDTIEPSGDFDADQALAGDLYNMYVLNTVLPEKEVKELAASFCSVLDAVYTTNIVISWETLTREDKLHGAVTRSTCSCNSCQVPAQYETSVTPTTLLHGTTLAVTLTCAIGTVQQGYTLRCNGGTLEQAGGYVSCLPCLPYTHYQEKQCVECETGYVSGTGANKCFSASSRNYERKN